MLSVTPLSPQPSREGPAPAAVASAIPQQCRTQQSRRRSLSLRAEHLLPASVYPSVVVVSHLLIALMSRVQVCIPVVPVAHACRPRAGEPARPPARCSVPAGSQLLYKNFGEIRNERLAALGPSLPCSGEQTKCKFSCGLSGLRRSAAQHPPAQQCRRPTPWCSVSPGELLAGRKQAAEAAGRRKGMHGSSSSPVGMLQSTVGVGVHALPTQLPSRPSLITRSCHGTEP